MAHGNSQRRVDADGVVWIGEPGRPWLRTVLAVVAVALIGYAGFWFLQPEPKPRDAPDPEPPRAVTAPAQAQPVPENPLDKAVLQALEKQPLPPPEDPTPSEPAATPQAGQQEIYVEQLPPGDGTGISAFPKPGTKPLKGGIIVPEGYTLPPGYVRHYQTTDDGEQLPAILMFHPEYHPAGVNIPADRIVPPELAPTGMPLQILQPPPLRKDHK